MLEIKDLRATVEGSEILQGLNLTIGEGEVHAIMGLNGSGKSTLAKVLTGREEYEVTGGSVNFLGNDLLEMAAEERAQQGIFMAFQYPVELPGVNGTYFLRTALNAVRKAHGEEAIAVAEFSKLLKAEADHLGIDHAMLNRPVNEGFSGGEKKRNEILQMALLQPKLAILDETDSGLDIDALQVVSAGVNRLRDGKRSFLVITHYQRLLDYIIPDFVHVMIDGKIVLTGDKSLALKLEEQGYSWVKDEHAAAAN